MSTRCSITAKCKDGKYRSIYCHFDGYIDGVGKTLLDHCNTQEKIEKLLSLGNISSLGKSIDCPVGHTWDSPVKDYTVAYFRDKKEKEYECRVNDSFDECLRENFQDYNYYWDRKEWFVIVDNYNNIKNLKEELAIKN